MSKLSETVRELIIPIGQWSGRNFPTSKWHDSLVGIQEEVGEFSHAVLKGKQGIRGTLAAHREAAIDALCDMSIYAMDMLYRMFGGDPQVVLAVDRLFADLDHMVGDEGAVVMSDDPAFACLSIGAVVGIMAKAYTDSVEWDDERYLEPMPRGAVAVLYQAEVFGRKVFGIDLADEIRKTWAKVQQRDWVANPVDAADIAETEAATA